MTSCLNRRLVERAQTWLGTTVKIRVEGLPAQKAHQAISEAFGEIAQVHRLMSFHSPASDVSLLNREASICPISVHPCTLTVLEQAIALSAVTDGCFDVSIGAELVESGILPRPPGIVSRPKGNWEDIEISEDGRVSFRRPLWIDLGGIAKGYAVDRAIERLRRRGAVHAVVNAGGDIRVHGNRLEPICLDPGVPQNPVPVVELAGGSIAGSGGYLRRRCGRKNLCGPHLDGRVRRPCPANRFVCVVAERCIIADALTKLVMAEGNSSRECLRQFGATAHVHEPGVGWRSIGEGTEEIG